MSLQKHSLAFNGDLDVTEMRNPLKPEGEKVSTIEFRLKTLRDRGLQGILCSKQQFKGSICIYLHDGRVALKVFGNHITSSKAVVSSPTHIFEYRLRPYTGYAVAVVYATLPNSMGYAKLYINGKLHGTKFYATGNPAIMSKMLMGGIEGHQRTYFQGFIDELRVWALPRTPHQIKQYYDKELVGIEQGLVAYFPFDRPAKVQSSLGTSKWEIIVHNVEFSDEFRYGHTKFQLAPMSHTRNT